MSRNDALRRENLIVDSDCYQVEVSLATLGCWGHDRFLVSVSQHAKYLENLPEEQTECHLCVCHSICLPAIGCCVDESTPLSGRSNVLCVATGRCTCDVTRVAVHNVFMNLQPVVVRVT